jgi:hypothetical protein
LPGCHIADCSSCCHPVCHRPTVSGAGQPPGCQGGAPHWTNDLGGLGAGLLGSAWVDGGRDGSSPPSRSRSAPVGGSLQVRSAAVEAGRAGRCRPEVASRPAAGRPARRLRRALIR